MKKKFILLLLILSFTAFAQVSEEEAQGDETEALTDETFEQEMFVQKQEYISHEPSLFAEESVAEEEVYDAEVDYND